MKMKKLIVSTLIGATIFTGSLTAAFGMNYTVQSGDTFWIISQKFEVDIYDLMNANNANEKTMLHIGQNITIPEEDSSNIHTVQAGDTFWIISQKHNVNILELMKVNNATEKTVLNIGDKIIIPSSTSTEEGKIHTVQSGDTFWIISQKYGVDIYDLMNANNANQSTVLNIGDKIIIPTKETTQTTKTYTVQSGDTYWIISQKFGVSLDSLLKANNATSSSWVSVGQKVIIPSNNTVEPTLDPNPTPKPAPSPEPSKPYVTYTDYVVQKGDNPWNISQKMGVPYTELLTVNNLSESSWLNIGDVIKIPVHNVPVKPTPGPQYGELLEWWTEAQYVVPIGASFIVHDFATGKSFWAKRTYGANHADVETLDVHGTAIYKEIFGGTFSWAKRPIIVEYNGRRIAASMAGMPHAGNEAATANQYTSWRSDDWGAGTNFDVIKGNNMDGHFDIHFQNSTRHKDGRIDSAHQENIKIAAGIK